MRSLHQRPVPWERDLPGNFRDLGGRGAGVMADQDVDVERDGQVPEQRRGIERVAQGRGPSPGSGGA